MRRVISHSIRKRAEEIQASFIEKEEVPEESDASSSKSVSPSKGSDVKLFDDKAIKEKEYKPLPKIKPPRRKSFNKTDEKGYRKDYQKEYRQENGNGYLKKNKKAGEDHGS